MARTDMERRRWGNLTRPGAASEAREIWSDVVLAAHTLRDMFLPYNHNGVNWRHFLIDSHRGPPDRQSYRPIAFREVSCHNHIPSEFTSFVDAEVQSLFTQECVPPWIDARTRPVYSWPSRWN